MKRFILVLFSVLLLSSVFIDMAAAHGTRTAATWTGKPGHGIVIEGEEP